MRTANDELKELIAMRAAGALTEREYAEAKAKLMKAKPRSAETQTDDTEATTDISPDHPAVLIVGLAIVVLIVVVLVLVVRHFL